MPTDNFLANDYKIPKNDGSYMKFSQGKNKFRILSSAITGYQYWTVEKKPVRQKEPFRLLPEDIQVNKDGMPTDIKHFWAFVVWNYDEQKIQILQITQVTIQRAMKIKIDNRNGDAKSYDWIITKSGDSLDAEYDVDVTEASPLNEVVADAYSHVNINLEALFLGLDPFSN